MKYIRVTLTVVNSAGQRVNKCPTLPPKLLDVTRDWLLDTIGYIPNMIVQTITHDELNFLLEFKSNTDLVIVKLYSPRLSDLWQWVFQ